MRTGLILIFAAVSMFIIGCSTPKLTPDPNMKYFYEITEGDAVEIKWLFKNAHRVKIDGFEGSYLPEGSIVEKPVTSREYRITAFKGFSDSLIWTVYVDVFARISTEDVRPGDFVLMEQFEDPSYEESEFLNGIINETNSTGPDELRIVRAIKDDKTGVASVYALLLDKLGNFISGYGSNKDSVIWNATNSCGEISANYSRLVFNELSANINKEYVDFSVLIDNSVFSKNDSIKNSLKNFIKGMNPNDNVMLSIFNHQYKNLMGLMSPELALHEFDNTVIIPKQFGFNGSFEALSQSIEALGAGANKNRAIVLVTYSNDNSTLTKTVEDLVNKAALNNVSIFVIGIGDILNNVSYRYLSSATGGKYYLLLADEVEKFGSVMSEILFTYRNSYKIELPARRLNNKCQLTKSAVSFSDHRSNLSATVNWHNDYSDDKAGTILAAGFDEVSLTIGGQYYENLNRIASQLKTTVSNYIVTGYSYDEGNYEVSKNFALMRAEAVKDYLVGKGVNTSKLIVRTASPDFAMFRNTDDEQLLKLNRRVEISKYKENVEKDYQLVCDLLSTETEAEQAVGKWEKRGYKAYYLRKPDGYQVMLWDFKDKSDAERSAEELLRKFNQKVNIE